MIRSVVERSWVASVELTPGRLLVGAGLRGVLVWRPAGAIGLVGLGLVTGVRGLLRGPNREHPEAKADMIRVRTNPSTAYFRGTLFSISLHLPSLKLPPQLVLAYD